MNTLKNYKALLFLAMIYLTITLAAGVMVNKIVIFGPGYIQGGAVITPLWYTLSDMVTEVYGYSISRQILWGALISQFIFAAVTFSIMHLPSPAFWHGENSYNYVFGNTLRIYVSGLTAFLVSGFINIYIISKWKILMMGRYFWIRNIGSSLFAEIIYTALIIPLISIGKLTAHQILIIIATSYSLKLISAIVMATPASIVVHYLKKIEGIDIYDYSVNFNPFIFKTPATNNQITRNENVIDLKRYKVRE